MFKNIVRFLRDDLKYQAIREIFSTALWFSFAVQTFFKNRPQIWLCVDLIKQCQNDLSLAWSNYIRSTGHFTKT